VTTALEKVNGTARGADEPRFDPVALAEAAAIRARTEAEAEAARLKAEAETDAIRAKAAEEAERQRIANERARMRLEREQADHDAKIAESARKREESERATRAAREKEDAQQQAQAEEAGKRVKSAQSWRKAALGFAIVCAIVALPVQMSAFFDRDALWLLAAPAVLEGGAWVVLRGAAAAVDDHRPHWHYRLIAWSLAFIAAGINLWHGLHAFDPATALGTAFASIAGPGVWDLHEHGRIRVRDGKETWRERRRRTAAEKAAAKEKAAKEKAAADARQAAAEQLATERAEQFPDEWKWALRIAAAVGETTVTEDVWIRAWDELHATKPGETVDQIRRRNAAARRVAMARSEASGNTPSKVPNAQRAPQMPNAAKKRVYNPPARPGRRTKGDTPKYVNAARKQAAITAKQAATGSH